MILQSLAQYYERLLEQNIKDIAQPGFSPLGVSYEIVLSPDGGIQAINNIEDTRGKRPRPQSILVPQPPKRASNIAPAFLVDKTSYVLGVSATSKRVAREHLAYREFHLQNLDQSDDPGLVAFCSFLRSWVPERFNSSPFGDEMLDKNIVFRLSTDAPNTFLHNRSAAKEIWGEMRLADESARVQPCLITGKVLPIERLHPSIKGVRGAQTAGASIVSFNLDAFQSYNKTQGANAPISTDAAFAYTTALNYLLRAAPENFQKIQIADSTVVFWALADDTQQASAAEWVFGGLLNDANVDDDSEAQKLRDVLENIAKARPLVEVNPQLQDDTKLFVLGLAPNASRLSIRFWETGSLAYFAKRFSEHNQDFSLEPCSWQIAPSAWQVVQATVPNRRGERPKMDDAMANLIGEFLRAVLTGRPYPRSLLAATVMRMRSDKTISELRVAICKAILSREYRLTLNQRKEEPSVSLNRESIHPGYRLGRLFAVLEAIQDAALGPNLNATIRDRYYGSASANPASIFPVLLRNAQNHLSKLRKDKPGVATLSEKDITEIVGGLGETLPKSLPIEAQGHFAIGYYHQRQERFKEKSAAN